MNFFITNRNQVLNAVKKNGLFLEKAVNFRNDREIVLAAVNNNGYALIHASQELRNDREIVLAAINNGCSLYLVSEELKRDREIVMAAVTQNGYDLKHASLELQYDREIVLAAIKQNRNALSYVYRILYNYWNNKKIYLLSRDMYNNNNILNNDIIKSITKFL